MSEGLLDQYFRLLAGLLPPREYGVIAEPTTDEVASAAVPAADAVPVCLC